MARRAVQTLRKKARKIGQAGRDPLFLYDTESIHDIRTATRGFEAALELLGPHIPERERKVFLESIAKIRKASGPLRDSDVAHDYFARLPDQLKGRSSTEIIRTLLAKLARRQEKGRRRLDRSVDERLLRRVAKRATRLPLAADAIVEEEIAHRAILLHAERARETLALLEAPPDQEEAERLHDLRIAFKRLRYSTEMLDTRDRENRAVLNLAKRAQSFLGKIHDRDVFLEFVERWTRPGREETRAEGARVPRGVEAIVRHIRQERGALLQGFATLMRKGRPKLEAAAQPLVEPGRPDIEPDPPTAAAEGGATPAIDEVPSPAPIPCSDARDETDSIPRPAV